MHLHHLSLLNYKNIADAQLNFSPHINCFIGCNGEGKTNILDAIYFLSFTKSATNAIDSLNIRHGEQFMMLQGDYEFDDGSREEISCGLRLHQKKIFRRGQKAYKRMADHIGLLPLIIVSPNDSALILGGSDGRRKFIDSVIAQYHPTYLPILARYNKALLQRNTLLRAISQRGHIANDDEQQSLEALEIMMAQTGEQIYAQRNQFIEAFVPVFQQYYTAIARENETVSLVYTSHCQRGPLLDVIQKDRHRDIAVGHSLHGIHRDDLDMRLGGHPIRNEASQGQGKTYLISLKLAQFDFLRHTRTGPTTPILLLDDLFDKLDTERIEHIIHLLAAKNFGQIFITDTNREHLDRILQQSPVEHKIFTVQQGNISIYKS